MLQRKIPYINSLITANSKIKLALIISDLRTGGAEMMLYKLLSRINRERFEPIVISLRDEGTLGKRIVALDIPVHTINMKPGIPTPTSIWRLIDKVRQLKPDLIQGWMYHANMAATLSTLWLKSVPVSWNIRHSVYSLKNEKLATAIVIKLLAQISGSPKKILYNSKVSANQHEKLGYQQAKTLVIPNGFDTELFTPSLKARAEVRTELNLPENTLLIGLISRYHPMKDHNNFLQAAAILRKIFPDVYFLLAGREVNWENTALKESIQTLGLKGGIHLLGERQDIPRVTAALDIATSTSSYGEGFANVIGEAMSCGVPCVVTNVGDSAWIVGESGKVVPPSSSQTLAQAWQKLIELGAEGRRTLGQLARERIIHNFSLDSIVNQYEELYESLIN